MARAATDVLKDLKGGKYGPVYFLQGDEPFYIDQISDYIEKNALQEHEKGFNQIILYGKDVKVGDVLTSARRFPMMAERQVVIVKEAQEISDLGKEEGQKLLSDYLKAPAPTTILVFCHKHKSFDLRKKAGKMLEKATVFVNTKKMYDNQVPAWLDNYIAGRGVSINPRANRLLVEYVGNNLERLSNEVDKILINSNGKAVIDEQDVEKYVGVSKEYNTFELQNALIARNVEKSFRILKHFDANPKNFPAVLIIAQLFSLFSKVLVVHQSKDKSAEGLKTLLNVSSYFVKDYVAAAQKYSPAQAMRAIGHIREADLLSKGVGAGSMSSGDVLRQLVINLMH